MAIPSTEHLAAPYDALICDAMASIVRNQVVTRLWSKDFRLWKSDPTEIANRLGWLTLPEDMRARVQALKTLSATARKEGIRDVVLLGMGGSSLGPEVFRASFGSQPGAPHLWVLDSTVPGWVRLVTKSIRPAHTLFLVASKSGGTIEVMSLFAHFWKLVAATKGNRGGQHFIAITDPGTGLEKMAKDHGFRQIFSNPSDIGGRYSVLSLFGLVPAALLGLNISRLLDRAGKMADRCRETRTIEDNPGAYLGAVMGALAKAGRDKVTILASPAIDSFGLWAEQLLAESTGKETKGIVPVAQEPVLAPGMYGSDRLFIYLRVKGERNETLDRQVAALARAGHPVLTFALRDRYDLAAEYVRWEYATAVAGHVLGIQPFDQPNVQESKDNTGRVLDGYKANGRLPKQTTHTSAQAVAALTEQIRPGVYVAILAYTTPSKALETAIRRLRKALVQQHHVTTTFGYGPRYLHSTGQLHKGGPASGIFLELVDRMTPDLVIPAQSFSFGTLALAQATGDLESLQAHGRPALRVSLGANPVATVNGMIRRLSPGPRRRPRRAATAKQRAIRRR
ncbi:MAG: glucose-6-phosphate isomerase [Nitrospira sp.]